ncbi:hypothetical protein T310_1978 [Rasamsonia emersonii CBS 393.64]|uniref:Uncharacterized protein n=1 Tax=Rasamsonia emersonii (strain ATCC 16479 / CBS 393.64 / IMI 116815) TaxID=1408163 RepID=A0A0F4Z1M1_RASE3|nr:hypothetical protein T310_1978 [Rasamsonia emersonii CBS 393.64]KKA23996.1 hypothetical protein T310_1978 [Rasamsonia emersonii CBS 393.64]
MLPSSSNWHSTELKKLSFSSDIKKASAAVDCKAGLFIAGGVASGFNLQTIVTLYKSSRIRFSTPIKLDLVELTGKQITRSTSLILPFKTQTCEPDVKCKYLGRLEH